MFSTAFSPIAQLYMFALFHDHHAYADLTALANFTDALPKNIHAFCPIVHLPNIEGISVISVDAACGHTSDERFCIVLLIVADDLDPSSSALATTHLMYDLLYHASPLASAMPSSADCLMSLITLSTKSST